MPELTWLAAVARLRAARRPGVLVTLATVRGHAPRAAGAKMVVSADESWGSIGGGNVEAVAIDRARELLADPDAVADLLTVALSDKAPYQHGVQCCGGEVSVLLEPLPVVPAVAIFGVGHVGLELARILARHDIELHLIDTRPEQLADARLAVLSDALAQVHVHRVPLLPEIVLGELPPGTHVLIMTHDHAEDAALCDAVLRTGAVRLDRADRLGRQVGALPRQAGRRGARRGDDRADPHADRAARHRGQGTGHDRGERRRRAGEGVRREHVRWASATGQSARDAVPRTGHRHPRRPVPRRRAAGRRRRRAARDRRRDRRAWPVRRGACAARDRRGRRPQRRARPAGIRRHARALPADAVHRRAGHAAAGVARAVRPAGGGAAGRHRLRPRRRRRVRRRAGRGRHDDGTRVRCALRPGDGRPVRGRGRHAGCA